MPPSKPSQPPCAVNPKSGEGNLPLNLSTQVSTDMNLQKFTEEEQRDVDASIAHVEYLLALKRKKEAEGRR